MQIAFWSTVHGQTATTSNTVALACIIALEYRLKMLVTHNHYERSTLETSLIQKRYLKSELTELSDTGIDALSRFIQFNNLDRDSVLSYTTSIMKNRLDLLMGTQNANKEIYLSNLNSVIETVLNNAKEYYDLLLVDVAAGENELSNKILSNADYVVVNLNQNTAILDEFFSKEYPLFKNKCLYLISLYDESSRYNLKNLQKKYRINEGIATIPYSREYADACNEGRAVDFFMKNINADEGDSSYEFIRQVKKSGQLLLTKIGIDILNKKLGE